MSNGSLLATPPADPFADAPVPEPPDPEAFARAVGELIASLRPDAMTASAREGWLLAFSRLDGAVAAGRSRVLSATPGSRTRKAAVRSGDLVRTTGMSGVEARRAVRLADTLRDVPAAADALSAGEITEGHATALSRGLSSEHRPAAAADPGLLDAARTQSVDRFADTVSAWERARDDDADGRALAARQHRERRASWSVRGDGMVRIEALLAPDAGAVVTGALHALSEHLWRTEDGRPAEPSDVGSGVPDRPARTVVQRHADAVVELARRGTAVDGGSSGGRPRVDVLVTVDLDRLATDPPATGRRSGGQPPGGRSPGNRCSTADGAPLTPTAARRLACDAGVVPAVLGADGDVLDLGRRTRTVPTALRNALVLRDGGCAFPGCDRPGSWCDAHHVHHWADGGPTDLANLVLLCSAHHHLVHEGSWRVVRPSEGGRHRFRAPDGTEWSANRPDPVPRE